MKYQIEKLDLFYESYTMKTILNNEFTKNYSAL